MRTTASLKEDVKVYAASGLIIAVASALGFIPFWLIYRAYQWGMGR